MTQHCFSKQVKWVFCLPFMPETSFTGLNSQLQKVSSCCKHHYFFPQSLPSVQHSAPCVCSSYEDKRNVFTPHWKVLEGVPPLKSYFFEGYYFRVSIPELSESFSIIYALERKHTGWEYTAQVLSSEELLFHTFKNAQFWRHEYTFGMGQWQFEEPFKDLKDVGLPRQLDPSIFFKKVPLGFQWTRRQHFGSLFDDNNTSLRFSWNLDISGIDGWGSRGRDPQKSTASWLSHVPFLFDPGYQVLMAHGLANGWLLWKGRSYPIRQCPVYIEKNWGQRFPKKWFWLQCNSFSTEKDLSVTSVGAIRRVLLKPKQEETVGMLSIHHRGRHYLFTNWTSLYVSWEVASWGSWNVFAESTDYIAVLRAWCDSPGHILLGPALNGLQPNTRESLLGHMHIQITERSTGCRVLDDYSNLAAVEVGGQDKDCWKHVWNDNVLQLPLFLRNAIQYFDGTE
ncbi:tocopherol cyclase [Galdieria sulphuraria]|uniref:Tocopherol cyclase n=1 Tax=Galdieria sulphuraria TaxID=130081 RepID=M2X9F1_GALSU|nr:tocopherol cyclase [Galdieria sulphuraria]EME26452.1 tocopherol cyclase [Galdieria sulphuraria]|eukprot:XP_005702972.1 tocopherol cyclase [Galdieria sulphuraria]